MKVQALTAAVLLLLPLAGCDVAPPWDWDAAVDPTVPPPGAEDSLNRPILMEGGVFVKGSDLEGDEDPASPFSTSGEDRARVRVGSFWVQRHEVTNAEYRRFDPDHAFPPERARHPVDDISWREAAAYAAWRDGLLPTEEQWEFAARGTESRIYPWGDEPPTCDRAHFAGCEPEGTVPVMSHPAGATPEGVHDLAGNVWEWVMPNWFRPGLTPVNDESRRMRGGGYAEPAFFLRAANRSNDFFEGFRSRGVGFRVVWPVEE